MKQNNIPRPAIALLITGLMFTAVFPLAGRQLHAPDFVKGFLTGLGLALETIAIAMIQRSKKNKSIC